MALTNAVRILASGELVLFIAVADHYRDGRVVERDQIEVIGTTVKE